ncbi:MAG: protein phosphatase 2C domain-containing protein [Proteobacteria bacterium]|nr:protein phosphatase 2C domain-containing protein [Pseudomonadota bacterium]
MLFSFAESHVGQRKVNEDCYLVDEELGLYIVADGVGGLGKGEIASKLACDTIQDKIKAGVSLENAVYKAHRAIIDYIKSDSDKQGMATTIIAVLFNENFYELAWVGDSRAYLWGENLQLLSKDDSYVELLLEHGHIGFADLQTHPDKNVISQALGTERKNIKINLNSGILCQNQVLIICSDGLYTIANELDIINTVSQTQDVKEISTKLVATVVAKAGKDNITIISIATNTKQKSNEVIRHPKIYREFNSLTGKILGLRASSQTNIITETEEVDPELFDRTELKNLTAKEVDLLDSVVVQKSHKATSKFNQFIVPIVLVLILIIIALSQISI